MPDFVCIVQEGQEAERRQDALAAGLRKLGAEHFGDDPDALEIEWRVVRKGFGWTAGEPSTTSLIVRSVPEGWPGEQRETFMREICEMWSATTGCTINEVVVTTWDGPLPL